METEDSVRPTQEPVIQLRPKPAESSSRPH